MQISSILINIDNLVYFYGKNGCYNVIGEIPIQSLGKKRGFFAPGGIGIPEEFGDAVRVGAPTTVPGQKSGI